MSPNDIVALAETLQLGAIAITDHDTIAGVRQALAGGPPATVKFLAGVEISAAAPTGFSMPGSFHILGYGIRLDDGELDRWLVGLQQARENRNPQIIDRLRHLGIDISWDRLQNEFGDGQQLGRPHIATLLVKNGDAATIDDAFERLLGHGRPAYVEKVRPACETAIAMIHRAGGAAVLAHPGLNRIGYGQRFEQMVGALETMGLAGIEAYYPQHSPERIGYYRDIARAHGLLVTGGTDYHGDLHPDIRMGSGRGDLMVPYGLYEQLLARCASSRAGRAR